MSPTTYATPGVYVEEISSLPPSVAEIGTAIPAFIGSTANHSGRDVVVHDISSLREYEERFGIAAATDWRVAYDAATATFTIQDAKGNAVDRFSEPESLLWYAIDLYFRNGGSRCYVISVSPLIPVPKTTLVGQLLAGLAQLERYDEPTLVVIPEASRLSPDDYSSVCQASLAHAANMKDRFVLLDAIAPASAEFSPSDLEAMRTPLGMANLDRGALYYPSLCTAIAHRVDEKTVMVTGLPAALAQEDTTPKDGPATKDGNKADVATVTTLESLSKTQTSHYNSIKKLLADQRVILPSSPAIAAVITTVDRERGVWKAPANVSLQAVIAPSVQVTDAQQGLLNIDATTGKSINVIRSFAGKGTMVWGARTLAGNDNEWRYISVRRLFITVEESVKKATAFAVFEANDTVTWLKVKGMIDSYLYTLWERGALMGAKAEDAYFVNVGLNKTMTTANVLDGLLIVQIGLAVVRPAEFILLRFSHKLAQ